MLTTPCYRHFLRSSFQSIYVSRVLLSLHWSPVLCLTPSNCLRSPFLQTLYPCLQLADHKAGRPFYSFPFTCTYVYPSIPKKHKVPTRYFMSYSHMKRPIPFNSFSSSSSSIFPHGSCELFIHQCFSAPSFLHPSTSNPFLFDFTMSRTRLVICFSS